MPRKTELAREIVPPQVLTKAHWEQAYQSQEEELKKRQATRDRIFEAKLKLEQQNG